MMCCAVDMRIVGSEVLQDGDKCSNVLTYECPVCKQISVKTTPTDCPTEASVQAK